MGGKTSKELKRYIKVRRQFYHLKRQNARLPDDIINNLADSVFLADEARNTSDTVFTQIVVERRLFCEPYRHVMMADRICRTAPERVSALLALWNTRTVWELLMDWFMDCEQLSTAERAACIRSLDRRSECCTGCQCCWDHMTVLPDGMHEFKRIEQSLAAHASFFVVCTLKRLALECARYDVLGFVLGLSAPSHRQSGGAGLLTAVLGGSRRTGQSCERWIHLLDLLPRPLQDDQHCPLQHAAQHGLIDELQALLASGHFDVNFVARGRTPLMAATDAQCIQVLLDNGARLVERVPWGALTLGPTIAELDSARARVPARASAPSPRQDRLLLCPITHERLCDPVVAADGHTYERNAIEQWLTQSNRSPLTNLPLEHTGLVPNYIVRQLLD